MLKQTGQEVKEILMISASFITIVCNIVRLSCVLTAR